MSNIPRVQCLPIQPRLQTQVPLLHWPCCEQRASHICSLHREPCQPDSQWQRPPSQRPWGPQLRLHLADWNGKTQCESEMSGLPNKLARKLAPLTTSWWLLTYVAISSSPVRLTNAFLCVKIINPMRRTIGKEFTKSQIGFAAINSRPPDSAPAPSVNASAMTRAAWREAINCVINIQTWVRMNLALMKKERQLESNIAKWNLQFIGTQMVIPFIIYICL